MKGIRIRGLGAYAPSLIVKNDDLSTIVETNDEWISTRTGIKERRISQGEDTSQIAVKASNIALERSNLKGEDIDLIIVATITPDYFTPSVACLVQKEIGATSAMAFDINAACSGFVYGTQVAVSMMESGKFKNALVIGAEILSKMVDWKDRGTCVLFGDGGGAVVLSKDEKCDKLFAFHSKSEGDKGEHLTCGALDVINPFVKEVSSRQKKVEMNGQEVFRFATSSIVSSIKELLEENNTNLEEIDYVVCHQANLRIIDYAAKKLNLSKDKFYCNLDRYGNTSSGSIPLVLNEMYEENLLKEGSKLILVGFGGGLTYGSALIEL